jgi:hypothetical protein
LPAAIAELCRALQLNPDSPPIQLALVEVGDGEVVMAEFALGFRTASEEEELFAGVRNVVKSESSQPRAPG